MPIIAVATSKGGAGKTTIARLLLGHAMLYGYRAAAVDCDLNKSLAGWATRSKLPVPVQAILDEKRVGPTVETLNEDHDFIVIDCAGAEARTTVFAMACADLTIVPVKLSDGDVIEGIKTMQLVESTAAMLKRPLLARVAFTAFRPRTTIAAHVEGMVKGAGLPTMESRLHDLIAFSEMTFDGKVPQAGLAGIQVAEFFDEVLNLTGEKAKGSKRLAS